MFGGKDQEIGQTVARLLQPILPPGAQAVVAQAQLGAGWPDVRLDYTDADGRRCRFSSEEPLERIADEIGEHLIDLHRWMAAQGMQPLERCRFTLDAGGRLAVDFAYEDSVTPSKTVLSAT